MNYIGKFVTNIRDMYNDLNPATLSGAIDVVIVEQEDGNFACSPFHVRFGKRGVFNRREKIVDITINGEPVELQMKLGETGEAFFVQADDDVLEEMASNLATSPLPGSHFPEGILKTEIKAPSAPPPSLATFVGTHGSVLEEKSSVASGPSSEMTRDVRRLSESPERVRHESGNDSDKTSLSAEAKKQQSRSRKRRRAKLRKQKSDNADDIFKMEMTDEESREGTPDLDAEGHPRTFSLPDIVDLTEEMQNSAVESVAPPPVLPSRKLSISHSFSHVAKEMHVSFASTFPTRTIPNDTHTAKSEGQLTPPKPSGMDDSIPSGCLSDSEVDLKKSGTKKLREDDGANVTWQWGELPETSPSKGPLDTATSPLQGSLENITTPVQTENAEQPKPSYLRGMFSFIRRPKASSPTSTPSAPGEAISPKKDADEGGKYLSDLVAENISHSQKEKYLALDTFGAHKSDDTERNWEKSSKSTSAIQPVANENVPDKGVAMPSVVEVEGKSIELVPLAAQERAKTIDALAQDARSSSAYSSMAGSPPLSDTDSEKAYEKGPFYRKTLRLTSDQIKILPLQMGLNEAEFCIVTKYQGSATCKCNIFLWRYDDKIVISDIDGTITKSDVLGHILPVIGSTWAQAGVAGLYNRVGNNGYKFLYLSSRAIGQANFTRDHLRSIVQENVTLPDGPLLLSPKSLFLAFHQEVIVKRPEEFKIACLKDIRALFPPDRNPFFAAYGNKTTDLIAYTAVGVPKNRIFTINYQGQLKHEVLRHAQSSYSHQSTLVDMMFPPLRVLPSRNELVSELEGADEFGAFSFWKQPLPDIEKTFLLPPPEEEPVSSKSGKTKAKVATNGKISASPTKDDAKRSRK